MATAEVFALRVMRACAAAMTAMDRANLVWMKAVYALADRARLDLDGSGFVSLSHEELALIVDKFPAIE